ncbi:MAG: hypothetical protein ACYDHP_03910 [Ferrimicrobium sp.]
MLRQGDQGSTDKEPFAVVRRGFDRAQVTKAFVALGNEREQLAQRVLALESDLGAAREEVRQIRAEMSEALRDPERASELLGREASEILRTASEAASAVRKRAEVVAAELLERARREAAEIERQVRISADEELEEARQSVREHLDQARQQGQEVLRMADHTSVSTIETAKREGRSIVFRSREHAAKLLGDAEAKMADLREEFAQLAAKRDAILHLFRAAAELLHEAHGQIESAAGEVIDGPEVVGKGGDASTAVPWVSADASESIDVSPHVARPSEDDTAPSKVESVPLDAHEYSTEIFDVPSMASVNVVEADEVDVSGGVSYADEIETPEPLVATSSEIEELAAVASESYGIDAARMEALFNAVAAAEEPEENRPHEDRLLRLEALFAQLRSDPDTGEVPTNAVPEEVEDAGWYGRFSGVCQPRIIDLVRRVKRLAQDELNEVLAELRSSGSEGALQVVVRLLSEESRRVEVVEAQLLRLVNAGASLAGGQAPDAIEIARSEALTLVREMTDITLQRVQHLLAQRDDSSEAESVHEVGVIYREARAGRLEELAGDHAMAAIGQGVRSVEGPIGYRWLVPEAVHPCPDCEDNVLAEVNPKAEAFPTGHSSPPAHPGCRCLIVPVTA